MSSEYDLDICAVITALVERYSLEFAKRNGSEQLGKISKTLNLLSGERTEEIISRLNNIQARLEKELQYGRIEKGVFVSLCSKILGMYISVLASQLQEVKLSTQESFEIGEQDDDIALEHIVQLEKVLPPTLCQQTAKSLLGMIPRIYEYEQLREGVMKLLYYISLSNFPLLHPRIEADFQQYKSKKSYPSQEELNVFVRSIAHIGLNKSQISDILGIVASCAPSFKKVQHIQLLADYVTQMIRNWLSSHRSEFAALFDGTVGEEFKDYPNIIFNVFDSWSKKTLSKESKFWPAQMMLLTLQPKTLTCIAQQDGGENNSSKFMAKVRKSLVSGKQADVAAECLINLFTAATLVSGKVSPLRFLATSIQTELQHAVFATSSNALVIGEDFIVQLLVASFRLNPGKVCNSLFRDLLLGNTDSLRRHACIKAVLRIASEMQVLPWTPTIEIARSDLVEPISTLFSSLLGRLSEYDEGTRSVLDKKKQQKLYDQVLPDVNMLISLCQLFELDPLLPLHPGKDETSAGDRSRKNILGIASACTRYNFPDLRASSSRAIIKLYQDDYVMQWDPENPAMEFWRTTSEVMSRLSKVIVDARGINPSKTLPILRTLESLLERRKALVALHFPVHEIPADPVIVEAVRKSCMVVEAALLMFLPASSFSACSTAIRCFDLLKDVDFRSCKTLQFNLDYSVYKKLAGSVVNIGGMNRLQKQIWLCLAAIEYPHQGNISAWEELYDRWRDMTNECIAQSQDVPAAARMLKESRGRGSFRESSLSESQSIHFDARPRVILDEWTNTLGILCSLSGVIEGRKTHRTPTRFSSNSFTASSASFFQTIQSANSFDGVLINCFFSEVLSLLGTEVVPIREGVKAVLGRSVSFAVMPLLFKYFSNVLRTFWDASGLTLVSSSDSATLVVSQILGVLKLIFERPSIPEITYSFKAFSTLILSLFRYVSLVLTDVSVSSLQVKILAVSILEVLPLQRIAFREELHFCESLVGMLCEWVSDFAEQRDPNSQVYAGLDSSHAKLISDLDVGTLSAMVKLLHGLEVPGDFRRYFSFFSQILVRTKSDGKKAPSKTKKFDLTIEAMSTLLQFNIESGLTELTTLGADSGTDKHLRAALLEVLATVLNRGTSLANYEYGNEDKYSDLLALLCGEKLDLTLSLLESMTGNSVSSMVDLLVSLFEGSGSLEKLIKCSVAVEVSKTLSPNNLFRTNSLATKLLTKYAMMHGLNFLHIIVQPVLHEIASLKISCELDPAKLPPNENVKEESVNVIAKLVIDIIEKLEKSLDILPVGIRKICGFVHLLVSKKFPDAADQSVGAFLFLRFIVPSLMTPENYNLVPSAGTNSRRCTLLVAKTLQLLANLVPSGTGKGGYMSILRPFVSKNSARIRRWYQQCILIPVGRAQSEEISTMYSEEETRIHLEQLHFYIHHHFDSLEAALQRSTARRVTLGKLATVLSKLGDPPLFDPIKKLKKFDSVRRSGRRRDSNAGELSIILAEYGSIDRSALLAAKVVYSSGLSMRGNPVVYYNVARWRRSKNMMLLLYHIIEVVKPLWKSPFEIVIDVTGMCSQSVPDKVWIMRLQNCIPTEAVSNIKSILIVNANVLAKKVIGQRWFSRLIPNILLERIAFVSSLDGFLPFISASENGLLASTTSLFNIRASWNAERKKEIYSLRVTNENLIIVSPPQTVFGKEMKVVEIYNIRDVHSVTRLAGSNEFTISSRGSNGATDHVFKSEAVDQVCAALNAMKARLNLDKSRHKISRKRRLETSDIPGVLINISLLNMGSPHALSRAAGYNLLISVCNYFHYSLDIPMRETSGICIPKTNRKFVVRVSSALATSNPELTLEISHECISSLSKASFETKNLCLAYLKPWIRNLAAWFEEANVKPKTKDVLTEFVKTLAKVSIKEKDLSVALGNKLWKQLGRLKVAHDLILDSLIEFALEGGVHSSISRIVADAIVVMTGESPLLFAGNLVTRLWNCIAMCCFTESDSKDDQFESQEIFPQIGLLLDWLLMISFDDMICVEEHMPNIVVAVILLHGYGDWVQRVTLHRLFINIAHAGYNNRVSSKNKHLLEGMLLYIRTVETPSAKVLFGYGQLPEITPFTSLSSLGDKVPPEIGIASVQAVAQYARNITTTLTVDEESPVWMSKCRQMLDDFAWNSQGPLQSRAIVGIGVWTMDENAALALIPRLLKQLDAVVTSGKNIDQGVSIIIALSEIANLIPTENVLFVSLFWFTIELLRSLHVSIFLAGLNLLEALVGAAATRHCFETESMEQFYMKWREGKPEISAFFEKLDQVTQISFKNHFGFALATVLVRGLGHVKTKAVTIRVLGFFLSVCSTDGFGNDSLPYIALLLPMRSEQIQVAFGSRKDRLQNLWLREVIPHINDSVLLFMIWTCLLEQVGSAEKLMIYEVLDEGMSFEPEAIAVTYEKLLKHLTSVIEVDKGEALEHVLDITKTLFSPFVQNVQLNAKNIGYLIDLGFKGMLETPALVQDGELLPSRNQTLFRQLLSLIH